MRNLVKRYIAAMIRDAKTEEGLTEENFKVTVHIMNNLITMNHKVSTEICLMYDFTLHIVQK